MPKFLVTYHGGGRPESEEGRQQAMAAFAAWIGATGKALVDPGAPLGASKTVSPGAVTDGAAPGPFNGYSILDAADLDSAVDLVRAHPYVERGGSLQVSEATTP
ncbi:MAG TPA: YciI family protein [Streptosporangiaceae bacterium]|nr:YciI family protein [Streptosporangiaceae bacterium]